MTLTKQAIDFLSHFMLKCNEITGTGTWNYNPKPIPCQATKQYVILGGKNINGKDSFNELSELFLEAANAIRMPEPILTIRLNREIQDKHFSFIAEYADKLSGQMHFFNDEIIIPRLIKTGVNKNDAFDYTAVGCCRIDIPGKMDDSYMQAYNYHNMADWMQQAFNQAKECSSFEDLFSTFTMVTEKNIKDAVEQASNTINKQMGPSFHFESIFLDDCIKNCLDLNKNGVRYRVNGHFFGGIATVTNSFYAVKRLVFDEKRFNLRDLMEIVSNNYKEAPELRSEIINSLPKFGNDIADIDNLASV